MKVSNKLKIVLFIAFVMLICLVSKSYAAGTILSSNFVSFKPNSYVPYEKMELKYYSIDDDDSMAELEYFVKDNGIVIYSANKMDDVAPSVFEVPETIDGLPVKEIDVTAFSSMKKLTKVILPSTIEKIDELAFEGCTALKEINIPEGVKTISSRAFYQCKSLENITLPQNLEKIDTMAFRECESLKEIKFPSKIKEIGQYAFYGTGLESIEIPASIDTLQNGVFYASKLKNVVIPANIKTIEMNAFEYCKYLEKVEIKGAEKIGYSAFCECDSLKEVKLPETLKTIENYAFLGDENLEKVYFGKSVETIGNDAFRNLVNTNYGEISINDNDKLTFYGYTDTVPREFARERKIKFVYLDGYVPKLEKREIVDKETNAKVEVNAESKAELKVERLEEESSSYIQLKEQLKDHSIVEAFDVSIVSGDYDGDILVTLSVDKKYEGKKAIILHLKSNGEVEKFEDTVKDGKVEVVVSELSPFIVGVEENSSANALDDIPRTGDNNIILIVSLLSIITLGAIIIEIKK